jgi:flagellar motor switch protein FliM
MAASPITEPKRSVAEPSARAGNFSKPLPFDFRRREVLASEQLGALQALYTGFAGSLGAALSAYLRTYVSASVEPIHQTSFEEFSKQASTPVATVPLHVRPGEGTAILGISHAVLFPLLEILLGGAGKPTALMDRQLTDIEKSLLEPLIRIVLQELRSAWQPLIAFEFALESTDPSRPACSPLSRNEPLLAATVDLRLPEANGALYLALPSRAIRQLLPACEPPKVAGRIDDRSKILSVIGRAEVDLSVSLQGPRMLFRDLLQIEAGDVIAFDYPLGRELDLELNGISKFKGHVVARGSKRAFQIKRELSSSRA